MKISRLFIITLVISFLISQSVKLFAQNQGDQVTIILSLDGFRWDYDQKTPTPALDLIAREGVKAVSLIPSFPSKTFPNHYTIATGLYPDHHGLVNNAFYDEFIGKSFAIGNREARFNPDFYGGEPIWITAQNQGVRTASFFWVGSDVAIQGKHPDYWKTYDGSIPFIQRIDTIIHWLSLPVAQRPRLIMAYYHEPDGIGHEYGPNHSNTLKLVHELDSMTGILYTRIRQLPDGNKINFIVVSDHGMGEISSERSIALRDYIPEMWPVKIEGGNPNFNLYAEGAWIDSAYMALKKAGHMQVWKPADVPEYLSYGKNPRVGDIIVVADSSWCITLNKPKKSFNGGTHGYDITNTDIHAIFYAAGPAFKQNYIHPSFRNTDIYPLLAKLLGIIPAQTDGDLENVIDMLKSRP
ncbi:MAG: ectonucleotide pyrophosphatase/phosphodiesterase [Lentimicrobium sp.]